MNTLRTVSLILLSMSLFGTAWADVPRNINIGGRLADATGKPLAAGAKDFTFKIFDSEAGGTEIWPDGPGESQTITTDENGLWNVYVGSTVPLTHNAFLDTSRWLQITVDDGVNPPETLPRIKISTTPYANRVATVDGAEGDT